MGWFKNPPTVQPPPVVYSTQTNIPQQYPPSYQQATKFTQPDYYAVEHVPCPKFYQQEFHYSQWGFLIFLLVFFAYLTFNGVYTTAIFVPEWAQTIGWKLNHEQIPTLVPIQLVQLLLLIKFIFSAINYSGFKREYLNLRENFPKTPTNFVKRKYKQIYLSRNNVNWFLTASYFLVGLFILGIFLYLVFQNGNLQAAHGGFIAGIKYGFSHTKNFLLASETHAYYYQNLVIIVGAVGASFIPVQIFLNANYKIRINKFDEFYQGSDWVVQPEELKHVLKRNNWRNFIICLLVFLSVIAVFYFFTRRLWKAFKK